MNSIIYVGRHLITFATKQHHHDEWELIYCTGGQGQFEFQDLTLDYGLGDIVIIPPRTPHTNNSDEGFTNIHLNIADATFPFREPMLVADDTDCHILGAFRDAFYFFNSDMESKQLVTDALGNLIVNYVTAFRETRPVRGIVDEIKSNITQNFTDCDYELDKYLRTIPFSYDYLRKLFKSEMGMTPHSYLTNLRVQMAEKLLCSYKTGELNISEIAYVCGYSDSLYFSRVFKKSYGCSPKQYAEKKSREK
ncbi:MAG: helix-turn-helix transcriptional regulator [Ruminiclostridium sp.]|nr:helix-turn-helix transcriptional regulator [Ruminiclostridium sp.]